MERTVYVGLDVHADTIAVAMAPGAVSRFVKRSTESAVWDIARKVPIPA